MLNEFDKRDDVKRLAPFKLLMDYANQYTSPASFEVMLQHLLGKKEDFDWTTFITNHRHFKNVVSEIITIHKNDKLDLATTVIEIKQLVDSARKRNPDSETILLYIFNRSKIPLRFRNKLDNEVISGNEKLGLISISFAQSFSRQRLNYFFKERTDDVSEYWYEQIIKNNVDEKDARLIPVHIASNVSKLMVYFETAAGNPINDSTISAIATTLFTERTFKALTNLFIYSHSLALKLTIPQIKVFTSRLEYRIAKARITSISKWLSKINVANHDGVLLTDNIIEYLANSNDIKNSFAHLDNLRQLTRQGKFDLKNILQRDLEFQRYTTELTWLNSQQSLIISQQTYDEFSNLKLLPAQKYYKLSLTKLHKQHAERVAHEAVFFLKYLYKIRRLTKREIVIIGNDRYGRQWIVEPLEQHLPAKDFSIRYFRAPSHMSMRLTVRNKLPNHVQLGFSKDFIVNLNKNMPHLVIADSASAGRALDQIKYSRATRDYVNWVAAFNHIRSKQIASKYVNKMQLPDNHINELVKWHEFTSVCRQIQPWINEGDSYSVAHWAPYKSSTVFLGDFETNYKEPDFSKNEPLVILANPAIYNIQPANLPKVFHSTKPYYFDGPENLVSETVRLGFGNHGFETRLEGPTTDMFIDAIQSQIKKTIVDILKSDI